MVDLVEFIGGSLDGAELVMHVVENGVYQHPIPDAVCTTSIQEDSISVEPSGFIVETYVLTTRAVGEDYSWQAKYRDWAYV